MNIKDFQDYTAKRVKERCVSDAYKRVEDWRKVFENGLVDEQGVLRKLNLNEAADFVGIPKKTLEDYTQIFHKVKLITDIKEFADKKMGFLRHYIKKNKAKVRRAMVQDRQRQMEKKMQKNKNQITSCTPTIQDEDSSQKQAFEDFLFVQEEKFDYEESYIFVPYN